jgi:hypothetical protein
MTDAYADLSGSGNQQVRVNSWRVGQEWGNNRTLFHAYIQYLANGYGSYTGSPGYWSISAPGLYASGSWAIGGYANRNNSPVLWEGDWWVGADGNGYTGDFNVAGSIDYSAHSSIGSGTAYAFEGSIPRIPKRPSAPRDLQANNIGPKSVHIHFIGVADDRGSAVDRYQTLISTNPNPEIGWIINYEGTSGELDFNTLSPATQYYVKVRAHNGSQDNNGWGDWSNTVAFKTLSGAYVGFGGSFPGVEVLVGKGGSYVQVPEVRIGKDDAFVLAS